MVANEWQPIETAPKEQGVLAWNGERLAVVEWIEYYGWWERRKDPLGEPFGISPQPTHWMPLPEPPDDEEDWRSEAIHLGI